MKTRAGEAPARRIRGVVQDAGDTGFDLVLDDGSTERIAYDDVVQARTVFEWGPQPKRGRKPCKKRSHLREEVVRP